MTSNHANQVYDVNEITPSCAEILIKPSFVKIPCITHSKMIESLPKKNPVFLDKGLVEG